MKNLQQWLDEYGADHLNKTNQKVHLVCVPLIFLSVVAFLYLIPFEISGIRLGDVVLPLALFWYVFLGYKAFFIMVAQVLAAVSITIGAIVTIDTQGACILFGSVFVVAWVGQFWGHKQEGHRPSFFKDLQYLLIGPLWVWLGQH